VQAIGLSGVQDIDGGADHSLALKSDGTVWAWGYNGVGELGDGTTTNRTTPVQVSGLSGVRAIAAGEFHSLAVVEDTTAPKVKSTSPANGATQIAPGVNVTATFTEAMDATTTDGDPSTINSTTFKLMKAGTTTPIGAVVSYDATAKKAILNPNSNLRLGTKYKAVVTTGAQDVAGNRLDQNSSLSGLQQKSWTFTIRN
jgi:hypothetical protein